MFSISKLLYAIKFIIGIILTAIAAAFVYIPTLPGYELHIFLGPIGAALTIIGILGLFVSFFSPKASA